MTALVVAAHPDDETLGAGGTIARLAWSGRSVKCLILGEGPTSRPGTSSDDLSAQRSDSMRAAALLGVQDVHHRTFPDNRFDSVDLLDVARAVETELDRVQPTLVLTHHAHDTNIDHRITHEAVLIATRPGSAAVPATVLSFEVPSSTEWRFSAQTAFAPTVFFDISDTLETKIKALSEYRSETRAFPHPRSHEAVRALATWRGVTAGVTAAEAFQLVRALR